ncbi:MAG: hypothetical protein R3B70_06355 [Polyangiaceae bacterium]
MRFCLLAGERVSVAAASLVGVGLGLMGCGQSSESVHAETTATSAAGSARAEVSAAAGASGAPSASAAAAGLSCGPRQCAAGEKCFRMVMGSGTPTDRGGANVWFECRRAAPGGGYACQFTETGGTCTALVPQAPPRPIPGPSGNSVLNDL